MTGGDIVFRKLVNSSDIAKNIVSVTKKFNQPAGRYKVPFAEKEHAVSLSNGLFIHLLSPEINILKNENGGYTVIDPKGVIGDPVFDLSRFILDEFRDDLTSEPEEVIIDFVQKLGDSVGISCEVLLCCLYIETVIWLFREELANGESLEESRQLITNMKVAYGFVLNEVLDVKVSNGVITLVKTFRHKTLEERAGEYDGKLLLDGEYDWGEPVGREVW